MSELVKKLIELINQNKNINEISNILNLSNVEIYNLITMIKKEGIKFQKKYYDSGNIVYTNNLDLNISTPDITNIITSPNTTFIHSIITSDLHIGNEKENLKAINMLFDYAINNNIHIFLNAGDLIDGMFGDESKLHKNMIDQINYLIKNYPFDKNILTFSVMGNHDMSPLTTTNIDLANVLKNYRHDIIPIGYGEGIINIKNDLIYLRHELHKSNKKNNSMTGNNIIIKGHSHKMKIVNSGSCVIHAPTLSNLTFSDNEFAPMAIEMHIEFSGGYFKNVVLEQLIITDKVYKINSFNYHFNQKNKSKKEKIKLIEDNEHVLKLKKED